MDPEKTALVTGATRGLGRELARTLSRRGWNVYGAGRSWSEDPTEEPFHKLRLDVTDPASAEAGVAQVLEAAGGLDLLVNNAGISLAGPVEETPIPAAHTLFETNYFGVVRMIQAALPAMRRQGRGAIVNIGSAAGQIGLPFQGHYAAGKFALEGLSEALRMELLPFGIRVLLIQPGDLRTEIWERRTHFESPDSPYRPALRRFLEVKAREMGETAEAPSLTAEGIVRVIESGTTRLRHPAGKGARLILLARKILPDALFFRAVEINYRLRASDPGDESR